MGLRVSHDLVLARYNEDVSWAEASDPGQVTVYNKGRPLDTPLPVVPLPNVGREAHTYLTHILRTYHQLPDVTVFSQAWPFDHTGGDFDVAWFLTDAAVSGLMLDLHVREWGPDGRLQRGRVPPSVRPARLSFTDWFAKHVGVDLSPPGIGLSYFAGAIFGVRRDAIRRHPKSYYEALLAELSDHPHPEEAYYLERAWPYVFAGHGGTISAYCYAATLDGGPRQVYYGEPPALTHDLVRPLPPGVPAG